MGLSPPSDADARAALGHFDTEGATASLVPHAAGLINRAWLVSVEAEGGARRYLLQQINRHVFPRPELVLENMLRITAHVEARLASEGAADAGRRVVGLVPTRDGSPGHTDARGETWRLLLWVEGTRSVERVESEAGARETALAFGRFVRQLGDLGPPPLHFTIPGFHDTAARVSVLERTAGRDPEGRAAACRAELDALGERSSLAVALAGPGASGLRLRPVHNDAKVANVLFDAASGAALAVVDLDTTMPGLVAHDFGDLVRSSVSDSAEDELELARVAVRRPVFAALAEGYLAGIGDAITPDERGLLVTGALVIVYEQAVRFLADHLDGDRYYRISRPGQNLDRARAQLALLTSLESARDELEAIVMRAGAREVL